MVNSYASSSYASAFTDKASAIRINELDTWASIRNIPNSPYQDAIGPYPFTSLSLEHSKASLHTALEAQNLVSLVLVTDPLDFELNQKDSPLSNIFDIKRPYKKHYIIDLNALNALNSSAKFSKHHRYEIKQANKKCETRIINLGEHLDEWIELYQHLTQRHQLGEIHQFSRKYFATIAKMPEFISIAAFVSGQMTSCNIWLKNANRVYNHLGASNAQGYQLHTSYAVYAHAIDYFNDCHYIDLGGVPDNNTNKGNLDFFKKGFANDTSYNWLCGSIVNPHHYALLCQQNNIDMTRTSFFPAYRQS